MDEVTRKIDNVAKIFSLENSKYNNVFRFSMILKDTINVNILKDAIKKALKIYPGYKVKLKDGIFWNYFAENKKDILVEKDYKNNLKRINFKKNNDYLFKVSYYENKINLDIYHVLTDGVGATNFLKAILYNYINLKFNKNKTIKLDKYEIIEDEYLKCVNKKFKNNILKKKAYIIKEKASHLKNKAYHYVFDLNKIKRLSKKYKVTITEYFTSLYMFALYKSVYDKKTKKDISITIPINLRGIYKVKTLSNFFTVMNVNGNLNKNKKVTFKRLLNQIHKEFKDKLTLNKIKGYVTRDVKLGTHPLYSPIPLFIKKVYMKYNLDFYRQDTTTTVSNVGAINIENEYKDYVDNIMVEAIPNRLQKAKCTICSYENKLTVALNSSMFTDKLEIEFNKLLTHYIGDFDIIL